MKDKRPTTTLAQANAAFRGGDYSRAIELYEAVIQEHPELSQTLHYNIQYALNRITVSATGSPTIVTTDESPVGANLEPGFLRSGLDISDTEIAVVVHIYYEHLWPKIAGYLRNISSHFRLYVTHPHDPEKTIKNMVSLEFPDAKFLEVENIGMDVLPFINAVVHFKIWNFSTVLKLHTKNDKTEDRKIQGEMLLDGVLATPDLVQKVVDFFKVDSSIGLIGPELFFRSGHHVMYNNRLLYEKIFNTLDTEEPNEPFGFIAGTIFWIRGKLLKVFESQYTELRSIFDTDETAKTGGDGTYAHAMERVFGALVVAGGMRCALTYPTSIEPLNYDIAIPQKSLIDKNPVYNAGSDTHVIRYKNLSSLVKSVRSNPLFDASYYESQLPPQTLHHNDDPAIHYVLHGDIFLANPSPDFHARYYSIRYKDITRTRTPGLVHFINHGKREGRVSCPSDQSIVELACRENLIAKEWIDKPEELITLLKHGAPNNCTTIYSKNYNPYSIPALSYTTRNANQLDVLRTYLLDVYPEELRLYNLIERNWSNNDYRNSRELARRAISSYGTNRMTLEILSACELLLKDWLTATNLFSKYWKSIINENLIVERVKGSVLRIDQPTSENDDFTVIDLKKTDTSQVNSAGKVCVYTTLFGDIDNLLPVVTKKPNGVDFICFSDIPRTARGWEIRVVQPAYHSSNLSAKVYKILPQKFLKEYSHSLFVDANTLFLGRLDLLINICRTAGNFVMWRHPFRRDVHKECIAIISSKRHEPKTLIKQLKDYSENGFPQNTGLTEGSFIWRSHMDSATNSFMDSWWQHIMHGSSRDQVSLGYLMWFSKLKPSVFPAKLGTSRDNIFFVKVPHNFESSKPTENRRKSTSAPRPIAFLYSENHITTGSTVMRGEQLSDMVKSHYEGQRKVIFTKDTEALKNNIVILTKGFLKSTTPDRLELLKNSDNILLADFVDDIPDPSKLPYIDALIASSISGFKHYMTKLSHIRSFHLTHHVDPRIIQMVSKHSSKSSKACKIGYFGELLNSKQSNAVLGHVDFHSVDTSKQECSWMQNILHYNCHYAVRERRGIDGFKPFLKGFTAAATGSNIIIQADEGDSAYYLGSDYPYLIANNPSEAEILEVIEKAKSTFNGSTWHLALDIMKDVKLRSSNEYVLNEFIDMINAFEN